jgi:hypothetical protein
VRSSEWVKETNRARIITVGIRPCQTDPKRLVISPVSHCTSRCQHASQGKVRNKETHDEKKHQRQRLSRLLLVAQYDLVERPGGVRKASSLRCPEETGNERDQCTPAMGKKRGSQGSASENEREKDVRGPRRRCWPIRRRKRREGVHLGRG